MATKQPAALLALVRDAGLEAAEIGYVGGDRLVAQGVLDASVSDLADAMRGRIPAAVGESVPASA
jgi:hypothetical protein